MQVNLSIREIQKLLRQQLPITALSHCEGLISPEMDCLRAEALMMLDCYPQAAGLLKLSLEKLQGDWLAHARRLWAEQLLARGDVDEAILQAQQAAQLANSMDLRAAGLAWAAIGYGRKQCWNLAKKALDEARNLTIRQDGEGYFLALSAQARLLIMMDRRLEARQVYEQLAGLKYPRAQMVSLWGQAYLDWLLGAFEQSENLAQKALKTSPEVILPLFVLVDIALARENLDLFAQMIKEMELRSPQAEILPVWRSELESLRQRLSSEENGPEQDGAFSNQKLCVRRRLNAFPTTVQRRDHCGPCTIELVLRYWKDGSHFSNDQIAQAIKYPLGGSPIYRMREFFHLAGFQTIRCIADVRRLKALVDAGYPTIVEEQYSESSHVSVVIGYDDEREVIEVQDPVTHIIRAISWPELQRLRNYSSESALVAFPRDQDHERNLARIGLLDDPALINLDQCALAIDEGRLEQAADLAIRAVRRRPDFGMAWILRLRIAAETMLRWQVDRDAPEIFESAISKKDVARLRSEFHAILREARKYLPQTELVYAFEGDEAYREGSISTALLAYQKALKLNAKDPGIYASLSACYYALRDMQKSIAMAKAGLSINPAHAGANAWMSRALAFNLAPEAVHYGQCAVEISDDWWLAHLALGEAYFANEDAFPQYGMIAARREVEIALSGTSYQVDTLLLRARIYAREDQSDRAVATLEEILSSTKIMFPVIVYETRRLLALLLLALDRATDAIQQVDLLLQEFPEDPWGCLQKATLFSLVEERSLGEIGQREIINLFEKAVLVSRGSLLAVSEYLEFLRRILDSAEVLEVVSRIRNLYPQQAGLVFLEGRWLSHAGNAGSAAQRMLQAIKSKDEIFTLDELQEALRIIMDGMGLQGAADELKRLSLDDHRFSARDLWRAWGVEVAERVAQRETLDSAVHFRSQSEKLLKKVVLEDDQDSLAVLHLGLLTAQKLQRESYFRRALLLSPRWSYARAILVNHLIEEGRVFEALQYSAGHEEESMEICAVHASALLHLGWYEQAALHFQQILQQVRDPDPELLTNLWDAFLSSGNLKDAEKILSVGLKRFPQDIHWKLCLTRTYIRSGRFGEADSVLASLPDGGPNRQSILGLNFDLAAMRQNWQDALHIAELIVAENPADGIVRRLRIWIEMGDWQSIQAWLREAEHTAQIWTACAWMAASIYVTSNREQHAQLCFALAERAMDLDGDTFFACYARAHALIFMGKEETGLAEIRTLAWKFPRQYQPYNILAMFFASEQLYDQALEYAERAVEYGAVDLFTFAVRGVVQFLRGNNQAALEDLRLAWKRADSNQRAQGFLFWWLLSILNNEDQDFVATWGRKAVRNAQTNVNRKIMELISEATSYSYAMEG